MRHGDSGVVGEMNVPLLTGVSGTALATFLRVAIPAFLKCSEWLEEEVASLREDPGLSERDHAGIATHFGHAS